MAHGGKIANAKVLEICPETGEIRYLLPTGTSPAKAKFDQIVVCSGPWTDQLFPGLLPLTVQAIPVTYWRDSSSSGDYSASSGFPVIFNARLTDIYGLPSMEYPG